MDIDTKALSRAATEARGLAMDAVVACQSGHLGLPLGCAEIGAVLFGHALRYNPAEPKWLNRDRFILSAGHGSMFLYAWLHLAGYPKMDIEQIKKFRAFGSLTPGHPEFHETPGVEATTGPLGQGVSNAVGYAVSQQMAAARYNTDTHKIFNNHIVCLAGDGCMQEGVAMEAIAFAGHQKLDNLILIYDSNDVTLDAMANVTQSEDTAKRFEAIEWNVQTIKGNDLEAFDEAFHKAKASRGKPQLIIAKTLIGKGIPEVAGTSKAHGEGGAKYVEADRKALGLPDEHFFVSSETRAYFAEHTKKLAAEYDKWSALYAEWQKANPKLAKGLAAGIALDVPTDLLKRIPEFPADAKLATRKAGSEALQPICEAVPTFVSGSADLHGSTLNYIKDGGDFNPANRAGRNIHYGIREHGMCGIMNGLAYDGLFRPSGATFLVFADYCRPSIRLASLSGLPVVYIFTHDSVGVGEDGPTHEPVETVSGLRVIPHLDVIRPADPEETAGAFAAALLRTDGPTLLALTRQVVPMLNEISVADRREGVFKGGYIAVREKGPLKIILMGAGSELQHAIAAARELGDGIRVVSIPSFHRFDKQPQAYREEILPASCEKRVAIEAGVPDLWWKYVGLKGAVVGISRFGMSAPGNKVMEFLGMTAKNVVDAARAL
ncbi:MAG TPA: transketolase [Chthoniobacteraceae bacterium]|nr:transketolase [Chthoniobacteraceae bacterium]